MILNKIKPLLLLLVLVLSVSCLRDKLDFDMVDDLRFNPELEAPLVKAHLNLEDLVVKDTLNYFQVDPDNALRLRFYKEEIFSLKASDFVEIPEQDPLDIPAILGQPSFNFSQSLGTIGGVELEQGEFHEGKLQLTLTSPVPMASQTDLELTILSATENGLNPVKTLSIPAGASNVTEDLALPGIIFDFTDNGTKVNHIEFAVEVLNYDISQAGTPLELELQLLDLELEEAEGYFGQRQVNIPPGEFDFDVAGLSELADGFYFAQPALRLIVSSNLGLEMEVDADIDGVNNLGKVVPLGAPVQRIDAANSASQFETSYISLNSNNSNLTEFLAALPSRFLYSGAASINPSGVNYQNFLNRTSEVNVGLDIDVPLEVSLQDVILEETISDIDFFADDPEQLEELTLIFRTSNGFPFDLDLDVALLDRQTGDSLQGFNLGLLQAANTTTNGNILQRGETGPLEVVFDGELLDALRQSDKLRFRAKLNTPGGPTDAVQFYSHFDLDIFVATRAKISF